MAITDVIGDYRPIVQSILEQATRALRIDLGTWPIDHICYRVAEMARYREMRAALMDLSTACATTQHNGREFSVFRLREPLELEDGHQIPLVELPTPKSPPDYPEGLEHIELVVADLTKLVASHPDLWPAIGKDGINPTVRLHLADGLTIKFHRFSLDQAIIMEGNRFESIANA